MKSLTGDDFKFAVSFLRMAEEQAKTSRCQKSQRGVVIVRENKVLGFGANNPPLDIACVKEICYNICRHYAVHAEQNAILDALKKGNDLEGSIMYHEKVKGGRIRTVLGPSKKSCLQCSKLILQREIKNYVLRQDEGIIVYNTREFYELTLKAPLQ